MTNENLCPSCSKIISEDFRYCPYCAKPLVAAEEGVVQNLKVNVEAPPPSVPEKKPEDYRCVLDPCPLQGCNEQEAEKAYAQVECRLDGLEDRYNKMQDKLSGFINQKA